MKKASPWIMYASYLFAILYTYYLSFYDNQWFITAIAMVVSIICANKCVDYANKINKNVHIAYSVGFLFSIFGLLGYWVYWIQNR